MKNHHNFDRDCCGSCLYYLPDEDKCDLRHVHLYPHKIACSQYLPLSPVPQDDLFADSLTEAIRKYCFTCPFFDSPEWCSRHKDFADPLRFRCG